MSPNGRKRGFTWTDRSCLKVQLHTGDIVRNRRMLRMPMMQMLE